MAQLVPAPVRKPRVGGLKDILGGYVDQPRLGVADIAWEDGTCGFPSTTRAGCYDSGVPAEDKDFAGVAQYTAIGPAFAQYAGVECFIGGDSIGDSYLAQARAKLEQGEDVEVANRLGDWAAEAPVAFLLDTANPLQSAAMALGSLEAQAALEYVGQPVILAPVAIATMLFAAGALVREGGKLITGLGTPVVLYGTAATSVLSIVGHPAVYASPITAARGVLLHSNLDGAIAERVYAIGVDCDYRYSLALTPTTP